MGLKIHEMLLLASGVLLLFGFLFRTALPFFRRRFERTADRRARDLREEFMPVSPRRVRLLLVAAAGLAGSIVMAIAGNLAWAVAAAAFPPLANRSFCHTGVWAGRRYF